MPYLISSIVAIVSALIILMTRYEADDSAITEELDSLKSKFVVVDTFVNTYIQAGGSLNEINFQKLSCGGILLGNIKDKYVVENCDDKTDNDKVASDDNADDDVIGSLYSSVLTFPKDTIKWQIIPIRDINSNDNATTNADFGNSAGSGYKLLVDMSKNSSLMAKSKFSESFAGREFCEKMLFGTFKNLAYEYDGTTSGKETFKEGSTDKDKDGIFACIILK